MPGCGWRPWVRCRAGRCTFGSDSCGHWAVCVVSSCRHPPRLPTTGVLLNVLRLRLSAAGGGRMEHYPEQRVLSVFGFSSAFGQAPHDVSAALLRRWLPHHDISVSYDGY